MQTSRITYRPFPDHTSTWSSALRFWDKRLGNPAKQFSNSLKFPRHNPFGGPSIPKPLESESLKNSILLEGAETSCWTNKFRVNEITYWFNKSSWIVDSKGVKFDRRNNRINPARCLCSLEKLYFILNRGIETINEKVQFSFVSFQGVWEDECWRVIKVIWSSIKICIHSSWLRESKGTSDTRPVIMVILISIEKLG